MNPTKYLLRYGELALKGQNRKRFEQDLVRIVKPRIKPLGGRVERLHKKLLVHCEAEPAQVKEALSTVFGLTGISPIWRTSKNFDDIATLAWKLVQSHANSGKTFAVRAKRADKRFPITSPDLQIKLAEAVLGKGLNLPVNLKKPDLCLTVNVDFEYAWVHLETWPGLGGLPVCRHDKHGLLLSGGIDSPVAGHLIQKRGGALEAVYFHTPPFTVEAAKEKVLDLCEILAKYQSKLTLHVVNFTETMKIIRSECMESYVVVLSRRFMMQIASRIMEKVGGKSLVTGESLGQVASQTIENIYAVNHGVTYPILRPLIGMDKLEIVNIAKKIGSYDISIQPFEDCCSLFSPKSPVTRARMEAIEKNEARLNVQGIIEQALENVETIELG